MSAKEDYLYRTGFTPYIASVLADLEDTST